MQSLQKGIGKLEVNDAAINRDLEASWEVLAEPIQTVMRRYGIENPYDQLKAMTRGQAITEPMLREFVATLDIPDSAKQSLLAMTPGNYTGNASTQARAIKNY